MTAALRDHYETLELSSPKPHVLVVTLNRPAAANAFNTQMGRDICEAFEALALDPGEIRVIVVTGAGDNAFCAGGDLKERKGMTDAQWSYQHRIFERMIRAIIDCPTPVIGAVNGAAYGGGCELALGLDFLYAAPDAKFAQTEVGLGIIPGAGGTQNLPRAIGERRAKELIMSGKPFTGAQARDWGMVNECFAREELLEKTLGIAQKIADNAPIAVRQAKQAIHRGLQMSLTDGLWFEIESYNRCVPTQDRHEGVLAFNEKRRPNFKGQ